jgi:GTP:adenosylcobinamide-phosphate guanylyltransferase
MIDYVIDALTASQVMPPFAISGLDAGHDVRLCAAPSGGGPADSTLMSLQELGHYPALMTTCDHPLLTAEMIDYFIVGAKASGADICVGLADKTTIAPAYPNVKRTYLKFSDRAVSGCNLFYIANENGLAAIEFWKTAQQHRKQPWKLARAFSPRLLISYLLGRLTLARAFAYASKALSISAAPVMLPFAEAAIDVDKPSDKLLVEQILERGYPKGNRRPKPIKDVP